MTPLERADLRLIRALNRDPKEEHVPIHNLRLAVHALQHPLATDESKERMLTYLADQLETSA